MSLMENRYHKVVGLDLVLKWSRKKCGGPRSGPKLIHICTKTVILITEIKTQEYHVNLHLLLIFLISMVPHLGVSENNNLFCGFLKVKCRTCVVVDKTQTTYGHRLMDLRTY